MPNEASTSQTLIETPTPTLSKAEISRQRRETQEKQRAAKAAAKASGASSSQSSKKTAAINPAAASQANAKKTAAQKGHSSKPSKDLTIDEITQSRGSRMFSHFGLPKTSSHTAKGDIHPVIIQLALQFAEFKILGANARCIAALTAFKTVIQDYVTPANTTLSRHLMTYLSPQISHLVTARPMSVTMGNAIRELKLEISGSDIDMPEQDAKNALCEKIDDYIRDRIIIADEVIQDTAGKKIKNGDVILTYARSSVVEKTILHAAAEGKDFSILVVDSRPMLEGKALLSVLSRAGIKCTYLLLPAIGSVIAEVSTVFLGAHSLHPNGAVFSRAGTALVAMMAKQHSVPVVVCCETYKYSEGVQLDGFTKNELAPSHSLPAFTHEGTSLSSATSNSLFERLNPLYDLTPPSSITAVVTEVGIIPPSSISSIPFALGRQNL